MNLMMSLVKRLPLLFAYYFVSWLLAYVFVFLSRGDTLDFGYFFDYLVLAWTFEGLELPMFIWILSLIIFVPLSLVIELLVRKEFSKSQSKRD